jgi:Protein of unknown function (DUF3016)
MRSITTAALLSLVAAAAGAAGTVNVTFVDPEKFTDAGNSKRDEPANLKVIEQHLKELGERHLRDGQMLNISVLDVDLAGYMKPLAGQAREVRVTQNADWPRIKVRYSLEADGATVKSAEETLADLNYGRHGQTYLYTNRDPLRHEKQMLDSWFQARFKPEP